MDKMKTIARTPLQLGNHIRETRRKLGLTQEQLAATVGLRQKTVSELESTGNARLSTVLRVLAALDQELVVGARTKSSTSEMETIF